MSVSILVVDDEPDVVELPPALSSRDATRNLRDALRELRRAGLEQAERWDRIGPDRSPLGHQHARHARAATAHREQTRLAGSSCDDGYRVRRRPATLPRMAQWSSSASRS